MNLNQFPYSDFHEMNLDWIIKTIKNLATEIERWEIVNKISYQGAWDITKQYTSWSIVAVNGTEGYISVQPVPAGIDYTNTDYWRLVADFTVQLAGIAQRVSTLESDNININNELDVINNRLNGKWSDRSVLFIGDSYLEGYNGSTFSTTYADYINNSLNFGNYYKVALGGAGFATSLSNHYLTKLKEWVNSQSASVLMGITDIYLLGGYNDIFYSQNDIITGTYGIDNTINYIKSVMPNAKITLGYIARAMYATGMTFARLHSTVDAYRIGATKNGAYYLEGSELCLHDYTLFASDRVHPTADGYKVLGEYLTGLILNNGFDYTYNEATLDLINVDYSDTPFTDMPSGISQILTKSGCTIISRGGNANLTSPITWTTAYTNEIKIGNFKTAATPNYFMPKYNVYIPVEISITHSGGAANLNGVIGFKPNGDVFLSANSVPSNTWNYQTFTGIQKMAIGRGAVTVPIEFC